MKLFSNNNILLVLLVVLVQSIKKIRASDCEVFKTVLSKIGNELGNSTNNCCEYPGVKCNTQQNIKEINLSNKSIKAPIPVEFGELINLEVLDLSNNSFNNTIPKELSRIKNLKVLNLNDNDLEGLVPYDFKYLKNLEEIKLNNNIRLKGYVPNMPNIKKCDYSSTEICHIKNNCEGNVKECTQDDVWDGGGGFNEEYNMSTNTFFKNAFKQFKYFYIIGFSIIGIILLGVVICFCVIYKSQKIHSKNKTKKKFEKYDKMKNEAQTTDEDYSISVNPIQENENNVSTSSNTTPSVQPLVINPVFPNQPVITSVTPSPVQANLSVVPPVISSSSPVQPTISIAPASQPEKTLVVEPEKSNVKPNQSFNKVVNPNQSGFIVVKQNPFGVTSAYPMPTGYTISSYNQVKNNPAMTITPVISVSPNTISGNSGTNNQPVNVVSNNDDQPPAYSLY